MLATLRWLILQWMASATLTSSTRTARLLAREEQEQVLPTGTVTFLLTDIEGSTRLWVQHPEAMRLALARHDALAARR